MANLNIQAVITDTIRDPRTGTSHPKDEQVTVIRPVVQLGDKMFWIQWQDGGSCILKPHEIKVTE